MTAGQKLTHYVPVPKSPFLEVKVRIPTPEQKAEIEEAAASAKPVALSLNQWFLVAAIEKLERDKGKKPGRK